MNRTPPWTSACAALLALSGCYTVGRMVPIVSATQAPPPPAGSSWHCFEHRTGTSNPSSTCTRDAPACEQSAKALDGMIVLGVPTFTGKCAPQATAACRHVWFADSSQNTHECFRSLRECQDDAERRIDDAVRQSACAEYR